MEKNKSRSSDGSAAGILSGLHFSEVRPLTKASQVARYPRAIVLECIDHQIRHIEAELAGGEYTVPKTKVSKDGEGVSTKTTVHAAPRRCYFERDGEFYATIRYGTHLLEIVEGSPSVLAGKTLSDVLSTYQMIRQAVVQGEADAAIERTVAAMRRKKAGAPA